MTNEQLWKIFKNTGSIEAYISYAQSKNSTEKTANGKDCQNKGDNIKNNGYIG